MFKRYVSSFVLLATLTQVMSCSKSSLSGGAVNPDIMSGVAATGAPISGGKVKIKGTDGADPVEVETEADGSYSADIASLREPYLVMVEAPSGEKYISVSSRSALAEGKKVNITPLSHMIVSNVFGKADGDDLFNNFESNSSSFSEAKLKEQKDALFNKLVDAGLIGNNGIVDSSVDLLNGDLLAGTSQGLDGLLDVIEVNTGSASSTGIVLTLKGESTPIITDKIVEADDVPVVSVASQIGALKTQLSIIDEIRAQLLSLSKAFSSRVSCNGAVVDDGSSCDVDTLYSAIAVYFHPQFQEEGLNKAEGVWDWICEVDGDGTATEKAHCDQINFDNVVLKDVTLIKYDAGTGVALINMNVYINGALEGSEEFHLKRDADNKFKILGNKKSFRYWIESESVFRSEYSALSNPAAVVDDYSIVISMWYESSGAHVFDGNEVFTLSAVSGNSIFPGGSSTMDLQLVTAPVYSEDGTSCSSGLAFSTTDRPYIRYNMNTQAQEYIDHATACGGSNGINPCNCTDVNGNSAHFDWNTQKITLSEAQVLKMNKNERITLSSLSGVASNFTDEFLIKRPLVITEFNAAQIVPSFGSSASEFCESASFINPLSLSVANGRLSHISLHHSYIDANSNWASSSSQGDFWDDPVSSINWTPTFNSIPNGATIQYSNLYLSSEDEMRRSIVRQISCQL